MDITREQIQENFERSCHLNSGAGLDSMLASVYKAHGIQVIKHPMADEIHRLTARVGALEAALRKCLNVMPMAAECPKKNSYVVDYTDKEWLRMAEATAEARAAMAKGGANE